MSPVVLLVEDEALLRAFAADVLEEAGFEVVESPSADYAILVLDRRSDVVVVFTDVEMPGRLDGLDLARFVHHRYPGIRILVASGRARPAHGDIPSDAIFFPKPYAPETLIAACQEFANGASL